MFEPARDEFSGGVPIALYRLVEAATVKLRGIAEPRAHVAGSLVTIGGYPPAAAAPLIAASLGAPVLSQVDATRLRLGLDAKPQAGGDAMTAEKIDDLPQWCATRDTVGAHNRIYKAGTVVRAREKPCHDFVRVGAVVDATSRDANDPKYNRGGR